MKFLITVLLGVFLASCAHHHETPEHHHHAYNKHCAYSVAHGDLKSEGRSEYKIEHGGKTYYFSNKKNMNKFKENIEASIKKANQNWRERGGRL